MSERQFWFIAYDWRSVDSEPWEPGIEEMIAQHPLLWLAEHRRVWPEEGIRILWWRKLDAEDVAAADAADMLPDVEEEDDAEG